MNRMLLVVMCSLLLTGCVVGSSNPFYTPDLVVEMPELNGTWYFDEKSDDKDESPLVVSSGKMTIYDDKGVPADTKAVFFKVEGVLFVDIFPDEGQLKKDLVGDEAPVHLINRVLIQDGKVSFNPLDYEWLAKEVDASKIQLPYQRAGKDADILFTATSEQWVEFLQAHKDDPMAFPSEHEAWLVKKDQTEKAAQ